MIHKHMQKMNNFKHDKEYVSLTTCKGKSYTKVQWVDEIVACNVINPHSLYEEKIISR